MTFVYDDRCCPVPDRASRLTNRSSCSQSATQSLHAHDRDVHARDRRAQPTVALVGDENDRSRLGDAEVAPGDPEVGAEELGAQLLARERGEGSGGGLEHASVGDLLLEELRDLVAVEVHRGGDDVARRVVARAG